MTGRNSRRPIAAMRRSTKLTPMRQNWTGCSAGCWIRHIHVRALWPKLKMVKRQRVALLAWRIFGQCHHPCAVPRSAFWMICLSIPPIGVEVPGTSCYGISTILLRRAAGLSCDGLRRTIIIGRADYMTSWPCALVGLLMT